MKLSKDIFKHLERQIVISLSSLLNQSPEPPEDALQFEDSENYLQFEDSDEYLLFEEI